MPGDDLAVCPLPHVSGNEVQLKHLQQAPGGGETEEEGDGGGGQIRCKRGLGLQEYVKLSFTYFIKWVCGVCVDDGARVRFQLTLGLGEAAPPVAY